MDKNTEIVVVSVEKMMDFAGDALHLAAKAIKIVKENAVYVPEKETATNTEEKKTESNKSELKVPTFEEGVLAGLGVSADSSGALNVATK